MTAADLDQLLIHAAERGEVVLYGEEDEEACFELARRTPGGGRIAIYACEDEDQSRIAHASAGDGGGTLDFPAGFGAGLSPSAPSSTSG